MIRNAGVEPRIIEYLKTRPSRAELAKLISKAGLSVRQAVRIKGTPYHELGLDNPAVTDAQLLDAMVAHPILINRPFVVTPLGVRLSRPPEVVLENCRRLSDERPRKKTIPCVMLRIVRLPLD